MQRRNSQGNVLFLILIAVALFAALSYAVTSASRSGGGSATDDKIKLIASNILNYSAALQAGIQRMQLSNGCTDDQFDFSNPIYKYNNDTLTTSANANSPSDDRCDLFSANGGNVIPYVLPIEVKPVNASTNPSTTKAGHARFLVGQILNIGTDAASGTESANDIFFSFYMISKDLCFKLNDMLGIPRISDDAPLDTATGSNGLYVDGSLSGTTIYTDTNIAGQAMYCSRSVALYSGLPYYYFKVVLRAR